MEEVRELKISFNKGGSGSETTRLAIPIKWAKEMGLNKEEREIIAIAKGKRILLKKASNEKKYLVIYGDDMNEFVEVRDTLEEANDVADTHWQRYTSEEKKKNHVRVGYVTEKMLAPYAFDDKGNVEDWTAYWDLDSEKGFFDSDKL